MSLYRIPPSAGAGIHAPTTAPQQPAQADGGSSLPRAERCPAFQARRELARRVLREMRRRQPFAVVTELHPSGLSDWLDHNTRTTR